MSTNVVDPEVKMISPGDVVALDALFKQSIPCHKDGCDHAAEWSFRWTGCPMPRLVCERCLETAQEWVRRVIEAGKGAQCVSHKHRIYGIEGTRRL